MLMDRAAASGVQYLVLGAVTRLSMGTSHLNRGGRRTIPSSAA
jgi:hypothetical protein